VAGPTLAARRITVEILDEIDAQVQRYLLTMVVINTLMMLRVKHIIVVGHYGCSGVLAALARHRIGLSDNWLRHIQDVHTMHAERFTAIDDEAERGALLCELNVVEQVVHVCQTTVVSDAWQRGQDLTVHGCIYGLHDGRLRDLQLSVTRGTDLGAAYAGAVDSLVRAGARMPDSSERS